MFSILVHGTEESIRISTTLYNVRLQVTDLRSLVRDHLVFCLTNQLL